MTARSFPPPWSVEDIGAAFVVTDSARHQLAYVYFEDEPGRRSAATELIKLIDYRTDHSAALRNGIDILQVSKRRKFRT